MSDTARPVRDLNDPLFHGIKVVRFPDGVVKLNCLRGCRVNMPGGPAKVRGRADSISEARRWAQRHRELFSLHDTGQLNYNQGPMRPEG